jgi:hypothetical protein
MLVPVAALLCAAMPLSVGCSQDSRCVSRTDKKCSFCERLAGKCGKCETKTVKSEDCAPTKAVASANSDDLPPGGTPGECFTKVFIPAQYKTVTERECVKEASERLEIIPAEYKWVEERIMVKEASKQLVEVPAVYRTDERRVCVKPAHTGWVMQRRADCGGDGKPRDVYCLVTTPAEYKTVSRQVLVTPACTREEIIPAQYETVRRQVVARAACTRRVAIPAEFADHERTVLVAPATVRWERIVCEDRVSASTVNSVKMALVAQGYKPGPLDGKLAKADWDALSQFQQNNRLGMGELTYETLKKLGVTLR